ncbi:39S ribosomal protein L52, mitochondrial isoform X4 [Hemicordylus capensis]|uniref:39S ribosomal protein L52, mitochondrial isoform X4 n=1 Tax=Hemicordylus capensis TaxID=884348 RepID=UPI00230225D6|nr:39S ribosomal protein L52, mitochondrial isoform X4 [Hemicordylus capensis]
MCTGCCTHPQCWNALLAECLCLRASFGKQDLSWYKYPWHRGVSTAALHTRLVAGGERNGRPAPPMKGQLRRQEKNEAFARRAVMLSEEIDHALEKWEAQKREQEQQAEEKRHNRLVPKGSLLRQTSK